MYLRRRFRSPGPQVHPLLVLLLASVPEVLECSSVGVLVVLAYVEVLVVVLAW